MHLLRGLASLFFVFLSEAFCFFRGAAFGGRRFFQTFIDAPIFGR